MQSDLRRRVRFAFAVALGCGYWMFLAVALFSGVG